MFKKLFHKLILIISIFGIIFSVFYENTLVLEQKKEIAFVSFEKKSVKTIFIPVKIENKNYNSCFFFEETDSEEDIEHIGLTILFCTEEFFNYLVQKQTQYNKISFFFRENSRNLYDLFCNWKFHLC